jgi:hypothetical protein
MLLIDGVPTGMFEKLEIREGALVLKNGWVPMGEFITDWLLYNANHPLVQERHDLGIIDMGSGLLTSWTPVVQTERSLPVAFKRIVTTGSPTCLLFESFELSSTKIQDSRAARPNSGPIPPRG